LTTTTGRTNELAGAAGLLAESVAMRHDRQGRIEPTRITKGADMKHSRITGLAAAAVLATVGVAGLAAAGDDDESERRSFKAELKGFTEVPSVSSTGSGEFRARVSQDDTSIEFELTYENLEGATTSAAHVHLGQKAVNGGVSFFLCGGGGRPACTPDSGTFTGTVTAADVIGPTAQGIAAGEIAEIIRGMRAGVTYANVHTDKHPGGEIRGQLR
jgi:hypothetical protein